MELIAHPLVTGLGQRAGLFWFTISPLLTEPVASNGKKTPLYLDKPETILGPLWALPDRTMLSLTDLENSPERRTA